MVGIGFYARTEGVGGQKGQEDWGATTKPSRRMSFKGNKDVCVANLTCSGGCGNESFCINRHRRRRQPYAAIGRCVTQKTAAKRRRCRVQNAVILTWKGFCHFFARHVNGKRRTKRNVRKDFFGRQRRRQWTTIM